VRSTTKVMCVKNKNHVVRTSRDKMSTTWDLFCFLVRQWKALRTCCSAFPITTKWCFDQDVKVVPGTTFTKKHAIGAVRCKNEGMLLQLLGWHCIESVVFACPVHEHDQRWTCRLFGFKSCDISYIDGFGCYHFCLIRFGLELIIFSFEILRNFRFRFGTADYCNFRFSFGTAGCCRTAG